MKITFERSGGFTGLRLAAEIELAMLAESEFGRLSQLVGDSGFFDLPEQILSKERQPDRFSYRLTVAEDGRTHTVEVDEEAVPEKLAPLIGWLTEKVGPKDISR